jgi:hypothetical protein
MEDQISNLHPIQEQYFSGSYNDTFKAAVEKKTW